MAAIVLFVGFVYVFIPKEIVVSKISIVNCVPNAVYRTICNEGKWKSWFPIEREAQNSFFYKGDSFQIGKEVPTAMEIKIRQKDGTEIQSIINIVGIPYDSSAIQWQFKIAAGWNPIKRISQYKRAWDLKKNMAEILDRFCAYVKKKENIYGSKIELTTTMDTVLITTQKSFKKYPVTVDVYEQIRKLRAFISRQDAVEMDHPMLNITEKDSAFVAIVAIPINKSLPNSAFAGKDGISQERMVPGHYMTSMVSGGDSSIREAFRQMKLFFLDYAKTSVAIPYQLLITDRLQEADSGKWTTKIYAPVY